MLDKNVIWNILVRENETDNFYNIGVTGEQVVITIIVNSFDNINKYKTLASNSLKQYKYHGLKVV